MNVMDREDADLTEIFRREDKPLHPDTVHVTLGGSKKPMKANVPTAEQKACEDQWNPVRPDPNWMDKLIACVKWTAVFGGLCVLFCYWQQSGQMADSAAIPSMCACCALAGLGVGKSMTGGRQ